VSGARLLGERAAIAGLSRNGTVSVGASCRILRARNGWIAVNLPREDDVGMLAAWLEEDRHEAPWTFVRTRVLDRDAAALVARGRMLGLPVAELPAAHSSPIEAGTDAWLRIAVRSAPREPDTTGSARPLIVDLSSLWAGPLCAHLLGLAGGDVIKVESVGRPDGARRGPSRFYDLLNAGKRSVSLDFKSTDGLRVLHSLLARADIVVDASRPRALEQLGVSAVNLVRARPGLTWVSITGYGRDTPAGDWIAFGDDAAAAAGLTAVSETGAPIFCGDAIADPLTGMHAAVAAHASWQQGGGRLLELSLRNVAAHVLGFAPISNAHAAVRRRDDARADDPAGWEVVCDGRGYDVEPPFARDAVCAAQPLGADTATVVAEFDRRC
jgi:hypothetical protein